MLKLEFATDSAAFAEHDRAEIATILNLLAVKIFKGSDTEGLIRDSNGNTVGSWLYEINEDEDTAKADAQARWLELEDRDQLDLY